MSGPAGQLTSISLCIAMERTDGTGFAVTSHDRDLTVDGVVFAPMAGLLTKSEQQDGTTDNPVEPASPLNTRLLNEADLSLGRWDNARVTTYAVDWEGGIELARLPTGQLAEIESKDGQYQAAVSFDEPKLKLPCCPAISPECRAVLGDKSCRVNLGPMRTRARVIRVEGQWLTLDCAVGDEYLLGSLRFLDGPFCGLTQVVVATSENAVQIRDDLGPALSASSKVLITQGCDKRAETCRARFQNMINFRGEPQVPGTDYLLRYPGA